VRRQGTLLVKIVDALECRDVWDGVSVLRDEQVFDLCVLLEGWVKGKCALGPFLSILVI
jgi:hypothetical protein